MAPAKPKKTAAPKKRKADTAPRGSSSKSRTKSRANDENQPPPRATRSKKQPVVQEDYEDDDATVDPNAQPPEEIDVDESHNRRARRGSRHANATDDDDGLNDNVESDDDQDDSDDDEQQDDTSIAGKPAGMSNEAYIRTLQRQAKELQQVQQVAVATATARQKVQNNAVLKKIEECVKTKVWHTCKFITNHNVQEQATIFVLKNLTDLDTSRWTPEEMADNVLTYKGAVGKFLNDKRNYSQSQMREVVLDLSLHKIDPQGRRVTGRRLIRDPDQPEDTPANEIRMVMRPPMTIFRMGLIERAITR